MKDLLTSRRFWVALFGVVFLMIVQKIPNFQFDAEIAAGYVVIFVSYLLGLGADPGENAGTWDGVIKSRKFWAAVVGFVVMTLNSFGVLLPLGITQDQLVGLMLVIGGYIASVAIKQPPAPPVDPVPPVVP
jgi:uncharacterized membrane protein